MTAIAPDMCRLTVVTPNRWADLALPAAEPLADLLPALIDHVGDADLDGESVVLQRLGNPPLDEGRSLAGNGVLDGETLYLNVAEQAMPAVDFDDAIAGLGVGIEAIPTRWKPVFTRRLLLGLAFLPLALGWGVLMLRHPSPGVVAVISTGAALCCLVGAGLASRAWADRTLAILLGVASLPFAPLIAAMALLSLGPTPLLTPAVGLAVAAVVFTVASLADHAVGGVTVGFAGVAFAAVLLGVACGLSLVVGWGPAKTLAVALVFSTVATELLVTVACRLAGVWLPPLPRNADELEDGVEPVPAQQALTRAAQVDQYLTALLWGSSAVVVVSAAVLADDGGWQLVLVLVCSASALLRSRVFLGREQRAALMVAGLAGPLALVTAGGIAGGGAAWLWAIGLLLGSSAALFAAAVVLPGRRAIPHYGRAAELLEGLVAASLLPVLLAVLGTYSAMRNLF
jgi:type VII secretion integral membrane protein EccD